MVTKEKFNKFIGSHIGRPGGVYVCDMCGKKTRETGDGESGCNLCRKCYNEAGMDNEISDGHVTCPKCGEYRDINIVDERFVCNKCGNDEGEWYKW